jgi:hypothetical protein
MSFADLRQTVLQGGVLNSDLFAEDVTIKSPEEGAEPATVRVKLEHDDMIRRRRGGTASGNESMQMTFDTRERIVVTLSRDAGFAGGLAVRPLVGTTLVRGDDRDPPGETDKPRAFAFRGEIVFEGDQHAVYVFERPRRLVQGKGN